LIARIRYVPSPPAIYSQIATEIGSHDVGVERVGELIARDPAITAKVLQLANSAFFGVRRKVIRPDEAVAYIGLETIKALVLLAHTFSYFDQVQLGGFCVESLWWHSVMTGRFALRIARLEESSEEIADHASAAGLLHDIGQLLFAANLPEAFGQAMIRASEENLGLWEAETLTLGACHGELGGCLLAIWGLPIPVVEAVALHHRPSQSGDRGFGALTAVHAANVIAHQAWSDQPLATQSELDLNYLNALDLAPRVEVWRRHCLAPVEAEAETEDAEAAEPSAWV
jgi:HD-like signal output (HDOD) protein